MKTLLLTLTLILATAIPAFAQHPCDTVPTCGVSRKSPITVGVCWDQKYDDGTPAIATSMQIFDGPTLVKTVTNPVQVGAANAAGLFYYQTTGVVVSKGSNKSLTFTFSTSDGVSDPSTACTFSATGKPSKPVAPRVE